MEIDFASLFKPFRPAFVELSKDFQGLHTKLVKYEESFNNFKLLNLPDASPKRKPFVAIKTRILFPIMVILMPLR